MAYKFRGKNYLFASSIPGKVTVPELGATFANINQAAESLGISVQRIAAVLTGKQKTAAGYHFKPGRTPGGGAPRDPREPIRKRIREKNRKANKIIQEARDRKRENFLDGVTELDDFGADVLGQTGDNLIDENSDVLEDMDMDELNQLENRLDELTKKAEEDIKKADERLQEYADLFGVSSAEMEQYEELIPEINRTIDRAKNNGEGTNIFYKIQDLIQQGVHPDVLSGLLETVNSYFDNPKRGVSLTDVLGAWEYEQFGPGDWEAYRDQNIY